ncbi:MAG TPA: hypothetical protein VE673_12505 [Pseudonocardiaceae bacterium]|jgi:hypothetical protein|nr:hypothetical protein [Pseudonocardiaceae bacterium]
MFSSLREQATIVAVNPDGEVAELVVGSNHRHAAPGPRRTEGSPRRRAGFVGMLGSHLIPPAQRASCGRSAGTHAK